jgi:hypothetical protein
VGAGSRSTSSSSRPLKTCWWRVGVCFVKSENLSWLRHGDASCNSETLHGGYSVGLSSLS